MQFNFGSSFLFTADMIFFVLLFFFSVHAFFLAYHWFTFGTDKKTSMVALATYLAGGAVLFLTLATSVFFV